MANYERTLKSCIWTSGEFEGLSNIEKLFYILIHTGEETSDCCIFQITPKRIAYHLGISTKKAEELINKFIDLNFVVYDFKTQEMLVVDYMRHNAPKGGLLYENYKKDFAKIKTKPLINELAEIAKEYVVTIGFLAALDDYTPINLAEYQFRPTKETLESVRNVQKRGRDAAAQKRKNESEDTYCEDMYDDDLSDIPF